MDLIQSVILGSIEGIFEYLPVSSTFHLIWTTRLMGILQTDFQKAYEVIIQTGAIWAVIFLYWKVLLKDKELAIKIFFSFLPTAFFGLILYRVIKNIFFENYLLQLSMFILIGIVFILYEKYQKNKILKKKLADISFRDCLLIGLVQSIAVIPGVSRAGAVILVMMYLGVKREEAAKFSFLLAVPTIIAASMLDLYKSYPVLVGHLDQIGYLTVGFVAAFISATVVVKWFIKYLTQHTLSSFGWYRILLGVILLAFLK